MKNFKKGALAFVLAILMFASAFMPHSAPRAAAGDAKTKSLQDQISELDKKIEEYKAELNNLTAQKETAMDAKAKLDALVAATQQKIDTAAELTEKLKIQIDETTARIAAKEEEINATFNKFLERMVVSYEEGDASYLSMILNSEDMADFLSRMDMVNSMLEYDRNLKIKYQNEKTSLEADRISLEEDKAYQEKLIKSLEADKEDLKVLIEEQETILKSLEEDLKIAKENYDQAKKQEDALDAELQAYLRELAEKERKEKESQQQGNYIVGSGFAWPLYGYTYISSGFGWRVIFGYQDYHRGIDIPAPSGTPIHASKGGKIVSATGHYSYGNYVVINHGVNENGYGETTLYAHMSMIGCEVGQYVNQGDVIGYVGTTGNSTGNHLHFEIRMDGEVQNPLNYVSP